MLLRLKDNIKKSKVVKVNGSTDMKIGANALGIPEMGLSTCTIDIQTIDSESPDIHGTG